MAQRTKRAIREAFLSLLKETSFDRISVLDITKRCDISRNTFYYYYVDVFALVDDVLQTETKHIRETRVTADNWLDVYKQLTAFVRANRRAIYSLYNSQNRDRVEKYLYSVFLAVTEGFIARETEALSAGSEHIHMLAVFYTLALEGLVLKWMQGGMTEDVDAYIDHMSLLLEGSVQWMLSRGGMENGNRKNLNS